MRQVQELADAAPGVRHHHERWDGTGYPDGLAGDTIPIEARIVAAVDAYSAMTIERVYRRAMERHAGHRRAAAVGRARTSTRRSWRR